MTDVLGTWEKIQQGMRETERLVSQKQNNLAMIKARQTLEYMVKSLAERACIVEGDMSEIIDQLYDGRWISKTTKDHYHKLRIIGNKAVHEGNDSLSDATLASHILSLEINAFAPRNRAPQNRPSNAAPTPRSGKSAPRRRRSKKRRSPVVDFLRILIPIICAVLLIVLIRALISDDKEPDTNVPATTAPTEPVSMEPTLPTDESIEETEPTTPAPAPETTAAPVIYRTTATLNVRSEPSTASTSRILVQLAPDTEVTVVGTYDDQWTIINYDGQDVYVATAYLTQ